jgi:hypothetical protein
VEAFNLKAPSFTIRLFGFGMMFILPSIGCDEILTNDIDVNIRSSEMKIFFMVFIYL